MIIELFRQNILNNRGDDFLNIVVKYLTIQFDESSMDCPNFAKYLAQLFANLAYNKHLKPDKCFNYFIKKYKEYSEYKFMQQKKSINKLIEHTSNELKQLQAPQKMIKIVDRFYIR